MTATFTPASSTSAGGDQSVRVTVNGQTSGSIGFHVQVPTKLVRIDYPGAPGGIGPLNVITDGNVVSLGGTVLLTHQCGVYRNYAFDIEEANGTSINGTYAWTESFSNYSTTVSGLGPPAPRTFNFSGSGLVSDIQFLGTTAPTCPGSNDNESFDMSFSVTIAGVTFPISTMVHISRGYFTGTPRVDSTITTP